MKYRISEKYLEKRKQGPFVLAFFALLITGTVFFVAGTIAIEGVIVILVTFTIAILANWRGARKAIDFAMEHYIELHQTKLISHSKALDLEIDLTEIDTLILNNNLNGVGSIILKSGNEYLAKLEHYESMDEIAKLIIRHNPSLKVVTNRWIHT